MSSDFLINAHGHPGEGHFSLNQLKLGFLADPGDFAQGITVCPLQRRVRLNVSTLEKGETHVYQNGMSTNFNSRERELRQAGLVFKVYHRNQMVPHLWLDHDASNAHYEGPDRVRLLKAGVYRYPVVYGDKPILEIQEITSLQDVLDQLPADATVTVQACRASVPMWAVRHEEGTNDARKRPYVHLLFAKAVQKPLHRVGAGSLFFSENKTSVIASMSMNDSHFEITIIQNDSYNITYTVSLAQFAWGITPHHFIRSILKSGIQSICFEDFDLASIIVSATPLNGKQAAYHLAVSDISVNGNVRFASMQTNHSVPKRNEIRGVHMRLSAMNGIANLIQGRFEQAMHIASDGQVTTTMTSLAQPLRRIRIRGSITDCKYVTMEAGATVVRMYFTKAATVARSTVSNRTSKIVTISLSTLDMALSFRTPTNTCTRTIQSMRIAGSDREPLTPEQVTIDPEVPVTKANMMKNEIRAHPQSKDAFRIMNFAVQHLAPLHQKVNDLRKPLYGFPRGERYAQFVRSLLKY